MVLIARWAFMVSLLSLLAGCGGGKYEGEGNTGSVKTKSHDRAGYLAVHDNTQMQLNTAVAEQVSILQEVKTARVIVTDRNAYVAVQLKDNLQQAYGGIGGSEGPGMGVNEDPPAESGTAMPQTSRTGQKQQGASGSGVDEAMRDKHSGNRRTVPNHLSNGNDDRTTGDNRSASSLTQAPIIPERVNQKIVDTVRSYLNDPKNRHIYVSANPAFFQLVDSYAAQGTKMISSVQNFNGVAQRLFPTTSGTGVYGDQMGNDQSGAARLK